MKTPSLVILPRACRSAEQETLRSAQNFGAFDIVHTGYSSARAALVEAVLVETDRGIASVAKVDRADAAYADEIEETVFAIAGDAGRKLDQVLDIVEIDLPNEIAGHGGDRQRYVHDGFGALGRRHDDFLDDVVLGQQRSRRHAGHDRQGNGLCQRVSLGSQARFSLSSLGKPGPGCTLPLLNDH